MAWTTPRTWIPGELVTATMMNEQIRDNMSILKTSINDDGSLKSAVFGPADPLLISRWRDMTAR